MEPASEVQASSGCCGGLLCGFVFVVGLSVVSCWAFKVLSLVYGLFFRKPVYSLARYGGRGVWAVITGSSDGIGKGFAEELAKDGFNLLLLSRTASKLTEMANQLMTKHGVSVKTLPVDFASPDRSYLQALQALLAGPDMKNKVAMLVNNVGVAHPNPEYLVEMTNENIQQQAYVNVLTTVEVTHAVLPFMIERKSRGAVITLASIAGMTPTPLYSMYSGCKAFDRFFSYALQAEVKQYNIDCLCVSPGYVTSNMSKMRHESFFVSTPNKTARNSLNALGHDEETMGLPAHNLLRVVTLLPASVRNYLTARSLLPARAKALRMKAEKAQQ